MRRQVIAALLGLGLGVSARAAEPGRAVVVTPCAAQVDAACWKDARPLRRFAADPRLLVAPVSADVRLAHQSGKLLVRVADLPEHAVVDVEIGGSDKDSVLQWTGFAGGAEEGVTAIPLGVPLKVGQVRSVRVSVDLPAGDGASTPLPWAPVGGGEPARSFPALVVAAPPSAHPFTVTPEGTGLLATAAGATVTVSGIPPLAPSGPEDKLDPTFHEEGPSPLRLDAAPDRGWYLVEARWKDAEGTLTDLQRQRVYLVPEAPAALLWHGITPAPRVAEDLRGAPLRPREGTSICVGDPDFEPAAHLLADQIARFTGVHLEVAACIPAKGDLWVGPVAAIPRVLRAPGRRHTPATDLPSDEGFYLEASAAGGIVGAKTRRGAVYGALALADAIGPDGTVPPLAAADWPDIALRPLFHRLDVSHHAKLDVDRYITFLRRVVARGRYNLLILTLRGAYRYPSHPELADRNALSPDDLTRILGAARELGMDVAPGTNAPDHAEWILRHHRELQEDDSKRLGCTRDPAFRALLADVFGDLIEAFGHPRYFHVGGDEVYWPTERRDEVVRCPRCAGTPRPQLYGDFLAWELQTLHARGVTPIAWSDMVVRPWNGHIQGLDRSLDRMPDDAPQQMVFMSWAAIGDSVGTLTAKGYPVIWGATGLYDARLRGLAEAAPDVAGAGFAIFSAAPWQSHGWGPFERQVRYHWPGVLLFGATAWRPALASAKVDGLLGALVDAPAYLPGYLAPPQSAETVPLAVDGPAPPPGAALPAPVGGVTVQGLPFDGLSSLVAAGKGEERATVHVGGLARAVSLLQATVLSLDADRARTAVFRRAASWLGPPTAMVTAHYADGQTATTRLTYGVDTFPPDVEPLAWSLWRTDGTAIATDATAPGARDRVLYRWDWVNPRPGAPIDTITVQADNPGVYVLIAGATASR